MSSLPFAKKSLGQHWLRDRASLEAMCASADIKHDDTILEIGPGFGTLTELLVQTAAHVIAVEFDDKLATGLPKRVTSNKLDVISGDILSFDFTSLPPDYKIVANIPYYLTSNLIRVISETTNSPSIAVLLVQKEVAERVNAKPGAMSLLSVSAQFYWQTALGEQVPAYLFTPPPKVDSQILILKRRLTGPLYPDVDVKRFFQVIKVCFTQRRKTLLNALSSGLHLPKPEAEDIIVRAGLNPALRPQNLSLDNWHMLYGLLEK